MNTSTQNKIYTLYQLNAEFKSIVDLEFGRKRFWVDCEVAEVTFHVSGHVYPTFVQANPRDENQIIAKSKSTLWRNDADELRFKLRSTGIQLEDLLKKGNKVRVLVSFNYKIIYGLTLLVHDIDPSATLGDIEKQKQLTLTRIRKEGLDTYQKKLYLSPIIRRIAVVGSPDTSGFTDFMTEIKMNKFFSSFECKVFQTGVQGNQSIEQICSAIKEAGMYNVEVIVVVRGGGSKMDLHVFNHYDIAKTIAYSPIPVISGIGHETDNCLIDLVSFAAMKTPTAVAEFLISRNTVFRTELQMNMDKVLQISKNVIAQSMVELQSSREEFLNKVVNIVRLEKEKLVNNELLFNQLIQTLVNNTKAVLDRQGRFISLNATERLRAANLSLKYSADKLIYSITNMISDERQKVERESQKLTSEGLNSLAHFSVQIENLWNVFSMRVFRTLEISSNDLKHKGEVLEKVDPTKLFSKGYTISTIEGVDLNKYKGDAIGKTLISYSDKSQIESIVKKIRKR